jgi:radical SAM-linked protein
MDVEVFREKLVAQLPDELPVPQVEEIYVNSPAATQLLEKAEYQITVATDDTPEQWQAWIEGVKQQTEILWEKKTKSGKRVTVNLCDRLYELSLKGMAERSVILRYIGSCRNDGTLLQPEQVIYMLEKIAQKEFDLLQIHRQALFLASPSKAPL